MNTTRWYRKHSLFKPSRDKSRFFIFLKHLESKVQQWR